MGLPNNVLHLYIADCVKWLSIRTLYAHHEPRFAVPTGNRGNHSETSFILQVNASEGSVLLPSTTALATLAPDERNSNIGRSQRSNPNFLPEQRNKYSLMMTEPLGSQAGRSLQQLKKKTDGYRIPDIKRKRRLLMANHSTPNHSETVTCIM